MDRPGKRSQQQEREARLAEALRQNLKRRKAQARARQTGAVASETSAQASEASTQEEPRPAEGSRFSPQSQSD